MHELVLARHGGGSGIRDEGMFESAIAAPFATVFGEDAYPDLIAKAVALGYFLIANHPFVDGNKRTGFLTLQSTLRFNGLKIDSDVDEMEEAVLAVARGDFDRKVFTDWVRSRCQPDSE